MESWSVCVSAEVCPRLSEKPCERRSLPEEVTALQTFLQQTGGRDGRLGPVRPPQLPEGVDQAQRKALVPTRSTSLFTWEDGGGGEAARGVVSGAVPAAGRQEGGNQTLQG